ncbi:hypothetical protein ZWY2020_033324 [Hordeum vulgare]|nr:hypothetical protein ZWY2020_033324 [Hordeum vulgare]
MLTQTRIHLAPPQPSPLPPASTSSITRSVLAYRFVELHAIGDLLCGLRGSRVELTFHPASEIYHRVASKCRSLHGRYLATPWLACPHLQTLFLGIHGRPPSFTYKRQLYTVRDGGTIALDWLLAFDLEDADGIISKDSSTPLLVVVPGLTSDSDAAYAKHLVHSMARKGWNVVVLLRIAVARQRMSLNGTQQVCLSFREITHDIFGACNTALLCCNTMSQTPRDIPLRVVPFLSGGFEFQQHHMPSTTNLVESELIKLLQLGPSLYFICIYDKRGGGPGPPDRKGDRHKPVEGFTFEGGPIFTA